MPSSRPEPLLHVETDSLVLDRVQVAVRQHLSAQMAADASIDTQSAWCSAVRIATLTDSVSYR